MIPAPAIVGDTTSLPAILQAIDRVRKLRPDVPLALATLVNVEGSSYRQPGARLLVDAEQRVLAGAISGGCLEGDVAARAAEVCASGVPTLLRYDLREDLETIWGFGAGCDGVAYVLLEPLADDGWLRRAHDSMMRREQPVLITTFADSDSAATIGAHELLVVDADADLSPHLSLPMLSGQPFIGHVTHDRGERSVLSEPLRAPVALHLIGAGRSAEVFAVIAVAMGWQVTVIDHRPALLAEMRLPDAAGRMVRRAEQAIDELPRDGRTAIALLTHIYEIDLAWLRTLLPQPVAYVGVLGSRNRAARLLDDLRSDGREITEEMQARLFAPIGLDLGGETPESIALAAVAEMEAVFHQRPGGFLKTRQSAIHTRTPVPIIVPGALGIEMENCAIPNDQRGVV